MGLLLGGIPVLLGTVFAVTASGQTAQSVSTVPAVHGTTFTGVKVDLPDALRGKVGVLVLGFSQGSRGAVEVWGKRLAGDYDDSPSVAYYAMPMLASVPKLLRGWVTGKIKASVSDQGKPHFLPLNDNEDEWKALTRYKDPDDAYLLVVDERGVVRWQTQGPPTDEAFAKMRQQVETLQAQRTQDTGSRRGVEVSPSSATRRGQNVATNL